MSRGRFDERCPYCGAKMTDLNQRGDYQSQFNFDCPYCEQSIECTVHSVPEYELSKSETPEEYAAKLAAMKARQK